MLASASLFSGKANFITYKGIAERSRSNYCLLSAHYTPDLALGALHASVLLATALQV